MRDGKAKVPTDAERAHLFAVIDKHRHVSHVPDVIDTIRQITRVVIVHLRRLEPMIVAFSQRWNDETAVKIKGLIDRGGPLRRQ